MNTSQQQMKEANEKTLFRLVREHVSLSRADLRRLTGFSPTTVSSLADSLIERGLFLETGVKEVKTSGRKATLLQVNPEGGYFLCVYVGKKITVVDCLDLSFRTVHHFETETTALLPLAEKIAAAALSFYEKHPATLAVITAFSGTVKHNEIRSSVFISTDGAAEFVQRMRTMLPDGDIPFYLLNDSSLAAYAETTVDRNLENIITVDIDDGVGSGILVKGHLFTGADGMAGEIGHTTIDCRGKECACGSRGCLELYVSIPAIVDRCRKTDPAVETFQQVVWAADRFWEILADTADLLSFGLVNAVNLFDPQKIVLSGPLTRLGDRFLDAVRFHTHKRLITPTVSIEYSSLTGNPVTIGGAKFAFDHILI